MKLKTKIVTMFMAVLMLISAIVCPQTFQDSEYSQADAAGTVMFSPYGAAVNSYYIFYNDCSTINIMTGTIGNDGYLDLGSIYHIAKKSECFLVMATSTSIKSSQSSNKITLYRTSSSSPYYVEIASSNNTRYFAKFTALNPNTYGYGNSSNTFYGFVWRQLETGEIVKPNSSGKNWRCTRRTQADGTINNNTNPIIRSANQNEVTNGRDSYMFYYITADGKGIASGTNRPKDIDNPSYYWCCCYLGAEGYTSSGAVNTLKRYGFIRTDVVTII